MSSKEGEKMKFALPISIAAVFVSLIVTLNQCATKRDDQRAKCIEQTKDFQKCLEAFPVK
jgi:hypothetical protein